MGIERSNLDELTIKKLLNEEYDLQAQKITKLDKGTANLFKIETKDGRFIVKEFNEKVSKEVIEKEIAIITFLKEKQIQVPEYVKRKNNRFYLENKKNLIVVQKFVEGYTLGNHKASDKQLMQCARVLGKMTKALKEFPELEENKNWCSLQENEERIKKMKQLTKKIKHNHQQKAIVQALEKKIEIAELMGKKFDFKLINKMTKVNSHGDFNNLQLIFDKEGEPTVIDFEKARKMPISYEVMESYCCFDRDVQEGIINIDTLVKYFQEFSEYCKLNEYDLKYGPYIFLIRLANSSYGFEEYNNDNTQIDLLNFALFRAKLSVNLYENLEKISLTLSQKVNA